MRGLAVVFGTGLLLVALVAPAAAQTKPGAGTAESEQVIITTPAGQESKVRGLLSRLKGKIEKRRLETTGSDVWSLPKARAEAMKKRLERMGAKVTRLKENWHHILKRHKKEDQSLTPAQQAVIDKATSRPETVNLGIVRMPDAAVVEHALTRQVEPAGPKGAVGPAQDRFAKVVLPLGETGDVTLVRTRPVVRSARGFTWSGEVEETGESAVLMLWQDGHLSGQFGYKGRIYLVSHMGGDIHTMAEVDPRKMPPDHAPGSEGKSMGAPRDTPAQPVTPRPLPPEPAVAPFPDAERQALEAKAITIDVMLLYTPAAARHYIREPSDLLGLAIEQANDTFRNSGLGNISLRLVHYEEVAYEEGNSDHFDHLYRMVDGEGPFKGLKKLRNEKRADVVGLIIDSPTGCGQATRVGAEAEEAFFVVHHTCASITYSIAHEIGHIIGARHDRAVDPNDAPFAFAHGYVNGSKWRDMMSYREGCGDCPRIPFWSNPRIMYKGEPTGTAAADNARVILEQAERVSKFR